SSGMSDTQTEDNWDHGGEHRPLIDVARHHVHEHGGCGAHLAGPIEGAHLFGEFREERRNPLHENKVAEAPQGGEREHGSEEWLSRDVEERTAEEEQTYDRADAQTAFETKHRLRDAANVLDVIDVLGGHAPQH